jgi:hypothetical protein
MTINNERLAKFEEKCWHEEGVEANWFDVGDGDPVFRGYICPKCEVTWDGKHPDYSTSPDDRERLWGYLMGKDELYKAFDYYVGCKWSEANIWRYQVQWMMLPPPDSDIPRWLLLLQEWLELEETRSRFGKVKCSNCIAGVEESGPTFIKECTVCDGSGRVLAPWAREAKEG